MEVYNNIYKKRAYLYKVYLIVINALLITIKGCD